jgi:hypothetical protein
MNKHTKTAIVIAPFLIVGGYIAADYYDQEQQKSKNLFELSVQGQCNLLQKPCLLSNNQLSLTLSNSDGITKVKSSHRLEQLTLSMVASSHKENSYKMRPLVDKKNWQAKTVISDNLKKSSKLKLRLVALINKGYYYSEFYSWEYE